MSTARQTHVDIDVRQMVSDLGGPIAIYKMTNIGRTNLYSRLEANSLSTQQLAEIMIAFPRLDVRKYIVETPSE